MLYVPLLILCLVKDLKYLVPFSITANVCIVVVFGLTLYYMFDEVPDPADRDQIAEYDKIPLFFATVIFAMEGIGVVSKASLFPIIQQIPQFYDLMHVCARPSTSMLICL